MCDAIELQAQKLCDISWCVVRSTSKRELYCILLLAVWTMSSCLSSELYVICSRSLASHMQPQPGLGWWLMHAMGGCTSGGNASLGEPAAYQASLHRFRVGMDDVELPE